MCCIIDLYGDSDSWAPPTVCIAHVRQILPCKKVTYRKCRRHVTSGMLQNWQITLILNVSNGYLPSCQRHIVDLITYMWWKFTSCVMCFCDELMYTHKRIINNQGCRLVSKNVCKHQQPYYSVQAENDWTTKSHYICVNRNALYCQ